MPSIVPCSRSVNGSSGNGTRSDMSNAGTVGKIVGGDLAPVPTKILYVSSFPRVDYAWAAGYWNLRRGFDITRQQPDLYIKLVLLYSLPPLLSAGLVLYGPRDTPWYQPLVSLLPLITMVVAPVVLMHAVDAGHGGERISVFEATRRGVPWVPRYIWTNVHTTVLFWVPVGALMLLWERSPLGSLVPAAVWVAVIGTVALHQQVRTV